MTTLPTVHKPGLRVWRSILLELLRLERAGEAPPSVMALAKAAGKSDTQTKDHLAAMCSGGMIDWDVHLGRHGSDVRLTSLGRLVARLLEVDFN